MACSKITFQMLLSIIVLPAMLNGRICLASGTQIAGNEPDFPEYQIHSGDLEKLRPLEEAAKINGWKGISKMSLSPKRQVLFLVYVRYKCNSKTELLEYNVPTLVGDRPEVSYLMIKRDLLASNANNDMKLLHAESREFLVDLCGEKAVEQLDHELNR